MQNKKNISNYINQRPIEKHQLTNRFKNQFIKATFRKLVKKVLYLADQVLKKVLFDLKFQNNFSELVLSCTQVSIGMVEINAR